MLKLKLHYIILIITINTSISSVTYYPACSSTYLSLVDGLRSIGVDTSFSNRKQIALLNGYTSYSGTATENNELFSLLKSGKLIKSKTNSISYYPRCSDSSSSITEALKNIGVDSSFSNRKKIAILNGFINYSGTASENTSLLNLCKSGKLISSIDSSNQSSQSSQPPQSSFQTSNQETSNLNGNEMINKLIESSYVNKDKKETIKIIGNLLFDKGYETAFIAGVLGNVHSEAKIGHFESSNYKSNPSAKPQYLKYMDDLYNYNTLYSGKSITSVSLSDLNIIIEKLYKDNWQKGKFGLGCVQWTGSRTRDIFKLYLEEANGSDYITFEKAAKAEGKMIISELQSSLFNPIYNNWKKNNSGNLNSENAAYNAGEQVCLNYEKPINKEEKAKVRGNLAKNFYAVMVS